MYTYAIALVISFWKNQGITVPVSHHSRWRLVTQQATGNKLPAHAQEPEMPALKTVSEVKLFHTGAAGTVTINGNGKSQAIADEAEVVSLADLMLSPLTHCVPSIKQFLDRSCLLEVHLKAPCPHQRSLQEHLFLAALIQWIGHAGVIEDFNSKSNS